MFRVFAGELHADSNVYNSTQKQHERVGHIYELQGKNQRATNSVKAGEIGAIAKLKYTQTGDTLCEEKTPIIFNPIEFPKPVLSFAMEPKSKGD